MDVIFYFAPRFYFTLRFYFTPVDCKKFLQKCKKRGRILKFILKVKMKNAKIHFLFYTFLHLAPSVKSIENLKFIYKRKTKWNFWGQFFILQLFILHPEPNFGRQPQKKIFLLLLPPTPNFLNSIQSSAGIK